MRRFSLPVSSALSLARASRPIITPNSGFERQLRIWEHCQCDVYLEDCDSKRPTTSSDSRTKSTVGDTQAWPTTQSLRKPKPAYKAWIAERDSLLKRGQEDINRARFSSMASMAAQFGRRRRHQEADTTESSSDIGDDEKKRRASWERVERMENEWNQKLMRGLSDDAGSVEGDEQG